MSIFAIQSAGKWLGQLLIQEVQNLYEVKDKVEELQRELGWMHCFLLSVDGKQNQNPLFRKWVSEISDLAVEGEDHIEMYILEVSHKRKDGHMNGIKWLACFWMDAKPLHMVGSQIDSLTSRVYALHQSYKNYGGQNSNDAQSSHTFMTELAEQRRTYAHAQPDYIVGLEADVPKLIQQLKNGSQKIMVVHGMGGIGKTALAREVYKNCRSQGHFVGCAWAYVSQQCNLVAVCKDLLRGLIPEKDKEWSSINNLEISQLTAKLCEVLTRNNYLVVLDDVWTNRDWKCLEHAFPIGDTSCSSRILVTTRNPQIFSNLGVKLVSTWKVESLKEDNCWKLLETKGHFKKNKLDSSMQEVAQKMLDHCNGHPLAILALGGVLGTKKSMEEWESVSENLQSHLQGEDGESYGGVYTVLAMSYYDLHYNLKPCFLHMGYFPEDFRVHVDKLYSHWIADGIVSAPEDQIRKKRSLEEVADNYLNQLVQKSMIQVDEKDADGRIHSCRLHDLMRDKCLEMTAKESFLQIMNIGEQQTALSNSGTDKARRLAVHVGKEENGEFIVDSLSGKATTLRSLMFISTCAWQERKEESCEWVITICKRFKLLRILDFEGGVRLTGILPSQIGNLIYLRHLSLRETRITKLPSSIKNLKFLLILDLQVSSVVIQLPNVLWELSTLCYLYFPSRHLCQEAINAPAAQGYEIEDNSRLILDKLNHLERIDNVNLDEVDVKGLLELTSMKRLSATCRRDRASLVPFLKSRSIKHLNLKIDANILTGDSNMLLSESTSLRTLNIDAVRSPATYLTIRLEMFPCNLVELGFWYCVLEDDPMPILEMLPKLRRLQLRICYRGQKMECSEKAFPELTFLALDGLFGLRVWNVKKGGLPKLQEMELFNCPIHEIPNALPLKVRIHCLDYDQPLVDKFRQQPSSSRRT